MDRLAVMGYVPITSLGINDHAIDTVDAEAYTAQTTATTTSHHRMTQRQRQRHRLRLDACDPGTRLTHQYTAGSITAVWPLTSEPLGRLQMKMIPDWPVPVSDAVGKGNGRRLIEVHFKGSLATTVFPHLKKRDRLIIGNTVRVEAYQDEMDDDESTALLVVCADDDVTIMGTGVDPCPFVAAYRSPSSRLSFGPGMPMSSSKQTEIFCLDVDVVPWKWTEMSGVIGHHQLVTPVVSGSIPTTPATHVSPEPQCDQPQAHPSSQLPTPTLVESMKNSAFTTYDQPDVSALSQFGDIAMSDSHSENTTSTARMRISTHEIDREPGQRDLSTVHSESPTTSPMATRQTPQHQKTPNIAIALPQKATAHALVSPELESRRMTPQVQQVSHIGLKAPVISTPEFDPLTTQDVAQCISIKRNRHGENEEIFNVVTKKQMFAVSKIPYTPIRDLTPSSSRFNIFGVVVFLKDVIQTQTLEFSLMIKILDSVDTEPISVMIFRKEESRLPPIACEGEIVSLHKAKVQRHGETIQCVCYAASPVIVYSGAIDGSFEPLNPNSSVPTSDEDKEIIRNLRQCYQSFMGFSTPSANTTSTSSSLMVGRPGAYEGAASGNVLSAAPGPSQVSAQPSAVNDQPQTTFPRAHPRPLLMYKDVVDGKFFDFVGQFINVKAFNLNSVVEMTDYTVNDDELYPNLTEKKVQLKFLPYSIPVIAVLTVIMWDELGKFIYENGKPGSWFGLRNVFAKRNGGHIEGVLRPGMYSAIVPLCSDDSAVKEIIARRQQFLMSQSIFVLPTRSVSAKSSFSSSVSVTTNHDENSENVAEGANTASIPITTVEEKNTNPVIKKDKGKPITVIDEEFRETPLMTVEALRLHKSPWMCRIMVKIVKLKCASSSFCRACDTVVPSPDFFCKTCEMTCSEDDIFYRLRATLAARDNGSSITLICRDASETLFAGHVKPCNLSEHPDEQAKLNRITRLITHGSAPPEIFNPTMTPGGWIELYVRKVDFLKNGETVSSYQVVSGTLIDL